MGCWASRCYDDVNFDPDQLGREVGEPIKLSLCKSVLNDNVFPLDVPELAQSLSESIQTR
jgi:hypothetical protein